MVFGLSLPPAEGEASANRRGFSHPRRSVLIPRFNKNNKPYYVHAEKISVEISPEDWPGDVEAQDPFFFFKGDEPRTTYLVLRGSQGPVSCVGAKGEHGGRVLVAVALIQRKRRPAEVDRDVSSEYLKGHGRRKFFFMVKNTRKEK